MPNTSYGIYLGHSPDAPRDFSNLFLAILNSSAGDVVKEHAFHALKNAYQIQNVSISGCSVVMEPYDKAPSTS